MAGRSRSAACSIWPGGDIIGANFVWTKGAPGYATNAGAWQISQQQPERGGIGWTNDGIFDTGTDIELTQAWSINAAYQHIWGPGRTWGGKWRTTVYGGYVNISYNDKAKAIILGHLPAAAWHPALRRAGGWCGWPPLNIAVGSGNSCSPDYSFYQIGSRTQFNPAPLMDIGLDLWSHAAQHRIQRPRELGCEQCAAGLHEQRDYFVRGRGLRRGVGRCPVAAQLLSLIA